MYKCIKRNNYNIFYIFFMFNKFIDRSNAEEEEAFSCPICLEGLTNSGGHRPACLKCGHIFGDVCLQRWIKVNIKFS